MKNQNNTKHTIHTISQTAYIVDATFSRSEGRRKSSWEPAFFSATLHLLLFPAEHEFSSLSNKHALDDPFLESYWSLVNSEFKNLHLKLQSKNNHHESHALVAPSSPFWRINTQAPEYPSTPYGNPLGILESRALIANFKMYILISFQNTFSNCCIHWIFFVG